MRVKKVFILTRCIFDKTVNNIFDETYFGQLKIMGKQIIHLTDLVLLLLLFFLLLQLKDNLRKLTSRL